MPKTAGASAAKKPRAPKGGHTLAKPLPEGTVLTDLTKKGQWVLGRPIGSGGFGLIYLAKSANSTGSSSTQYVIKLEPHSNGPLFCELNFYLRAAKPDLVKEWMTSHKQKKLGMPVYIASGAHEQNSVKYRFMVMQRFGTDLQKVFEENGKRFQECTVYTMAIQLLDTLEYIHSRDFVHADIKASNLLLGVNKTDADQVYLVDFGLASRYAIDDKHRDYKEDPKRTHDGTIEFTSCDAHKGVVPSRRGDLEILGYCLLQWLCGRLPWEDNLNNKEYVRDQKIKYLKDVPGLLKKCFPKGDSPDVLQTWFDYVNSLGYSTQPDYNKCRSMFRKALKSLGLSDSGRLDFAPPSASPVKALKSRKRRSAESTQDVTPVKRTKKKPATPASRRKPPVSSTEDDIDEEEGDDDNDEEFSLPVPRRKVGPAAAARMKVSTNGTTPGSAKGSGSGSRKRKVTRPLLSLPSSEEEEEEEEEERSARKGCTSKGLPVGYVGPPIGNGRTSKRTTPTTSSAQKAKPAGKAKPKKSRAVMVHEATQTSPGLKGLNRSRKSKN